MKKTKKFTCPLAVFLAAGWPSGALAAGANPLGIDLSLAWGIPFAGILLSIAVFPLAAPRVWHHHFGKVSAFWALGLAVPFLAAFQGQAVYEIAHIYLADYLPFIVLLWALYTVSGGILITGSMAGSPLSNTALLLVGAAIASWVGTTGAAMLLVRPFLRANSWRQHRTHQMVFFIFLVCNVGGALTPLGDPPLFLGFLRGVPFFWTLELLPQAALLSGLLLGVFYLADRHYLRREVSSPPPTGGERLRVEGVHNLLFLGGIVLAVLGSGVLRLGEVSVLGVHRPVVDLLRDGVLVTMGLLSLRTTRRSLRERNGFTWFPIMEVAYLFAGIFVTMIPVLLILKAGSAGALGGLVEAVRSPAHYFWVTGILSAFLDNAPTYLVFLSTALGTFSPGVAEREAIMVMIRDTPLYLQAVSAGAVFLGAASYIGNAPNFMVRSIAEEAGVQMPSFFGYIAKYSLVVLAPCLGVLTWIFFL